MNRRSYLAAAGTVGAAALAGCSGVLGGGDGATPDPVDLGGGKLDDRGGMEIGRHGGPNGQIFYADHAPDGHDNPAWFHTLVFGLFPYYFEHRELGWTATAVYATDYSLVEADVAEANAGDTLPAPTAAGTFGDARELTYVVGSDVRGGMGATMVPFSDDADVRAFVDARGGETVGFDDVTPELIAEVTG